MRFSIVTPVFNGMPWLPAAIESVAAQRSSVDLEHLVLDAGSTDGSREWLLEHRDLGFSPILEPDKGQTDALAKGFDRAAGQIFGWVNSDDLLEPRALEIVSRTFGEHPDAVIVTGGCILIDPDGVVTGSIPVPPVSSFDELMRFPTNLAQPATFFRADAYRRCGGLDRDFNLAMDVDLWLRLSKLGRIVTLPDVALARFRIHPAAKSVAGAEATIREDIRARRRQGMPWNSEAGRYFLRNGIAGPMWRKVKHRG